jgi:ribulose-5-phosphate 4-epimerase/fuculose-1-phosphate aldolase
MQFWQGILKAASCAILAAVATGSTAAPAPAPLDTDADRIALLVTANHVLAHKGVLEGFGHVSVRSASNPKHYFIAAAVAPGLVTRKDILEFDENSVAVDLKGREVYSERFIHGEIYRARPDVNAVVHSHASSVIPFSVTGVPLKPLIHVAFFLGSEPTPVFDLADAAGENNQMLVSTAATGAALAKSLGDRAVVLMRGHGMAVVGPDLQWAVFRSVYTELNARIELEALRVGQPKFMNKFEVNRTDRMDRAWNQWVHDMEADGK